MWFASLDSVRHCDSGQLSGQKRVGEIHSPEPHITMVDPSVSKRGWYLSQRHVKGSFNGKSSPSVERGTCLDSVDIGYSLLPLVKEGISIPSQVVLFVTPLYMRL